MKKALVIGLGVSGKEAARFLKWKGFHVDTHDKDPAKAIGFPFLEEPGVDFDLAILSPGIPPTNPIVERLRKAGVKVIGEIELACRYIKQPMIGITGSNGKTTTTLLVTYVLNACGKEAIAMGNVGVPLTSLREGNAIIVCELSSYQLETLEAECLDVAAILNVTPNHLDRYKEMEKYAAAKFLIQNNLKPFGSLIIHENTLREYGSLVKARKVISFQPQENHNLENLEAAFLICEQFGITRSQFDRAAESFEKPPHRIQYVTEIEGIKFYDDSKGTSVHATLRAVESLPGPLILIAGGVDKGYPYTDWIAPFKKKVKKIIAIGEAAPKIEKDLRGQVEVTFAKTLEEATLSSYKQAVNGDTILLSPGCASTDMFKDYTERGLVFQKAAHGIKKRVI